MIYIIEIDLDKIKKKYEEKEHENWKFCAFLKMCNISPEKLDKIAQALYEEISPQIDCTACGNCCKKVKPLLNMEDIEKLAKATGMDIDRFKDKYLMEYDIEKGYVFKMKPCPFLSDNKCKYYEYRPQVCLSYPHLHKKGFSSILMKVVPNCYICPIVFNVYERLKVEFKYGHTGS